MRFQACLVQLGILLTLVIVGVLGVSAGAYAETEKFLATEGAEHSFEVPAGVTTIQVVSVGGNGGEGSSACYGALGGHGAVLTATLHVTGGETLHVRFGEGGTGGGEDEHECAGGPGGGASELLDGGTPLLVAGGGGGGGSGTPADVIVCKDPNHACEPGLGAAGGAGGSAQAGTLSGAGVLAGLDGANGAPALEEVCEFNIETGVTCESQLRELGGHGGGGGSSSPGNGGTGGCVAGSPGTVAAEGSPGTGGTGATSAKCAGGGGGGGGYTGGGGGAGGGYANCCSSLLIGTGGGGAGSSYIDTEGGFGSVTVNTAEPQEVSISYTVAKECQPGYFSATGHEPCTAAPPGEFVDTEGATLAVQCALGYYAENSGSISCTPALPGYYVDTAGATTASACTPGSYTSVSASSSCTAAPPGKYVAVPASEAAEPCPLGTYQPLSGQVACDQASPGHYVGLTGQATQTPCPLGSYQPDEGATACLDAGVGYFVANEGSSSETQCPAGTTTASTGASSESDCMSIAKATCTTNSGTITLSPGLTGTAVYQRVKIQGTLKGCTGEPFTEAKYAATLTTTGKVTCSALSGPGAATFGSGKYAWTPKTRATTGTLNMPLTETADTALSGELESGPYSPLTLSGTASESYTNAAICGVPQGKHGIVKAVRKGTFSGSAVSFE